MSAENLEKLDNWAEKSLANLTDIIAHTIWGCINPDCIKERILQIFGITQIAREIGISMTSENLAFIVINRQNIFEAYHQKKTCDRWIQNDFKANEDSLSNDCFSMSADGLDGCTPQTTTHNERAESNVEVLGDADTSSQATTKAVSPFRNSGSNFVIRGRGKPGVSGTFFATKNACQFESSMEPAMTTKESGSSDAVMAAKIKRTSAAALLAHFASRAKQDDEQTKNDAMIKENKEAGLDEHAAPASTNLVDPKSERTENDELRARNEELSTRIVELEKLAAKALTDHELLNTKYTEVMYKMKVNSLSVGAKFARMEKMLEHQDTTWKDFYKSKEEDEQAMKKYTESLVQNAFYEDQLKESRISFVESEANWKNKVENLESQYKKLQKKCEKQVSLIEQMKIKNKDLKTRLREIGKNTDPSYQKWNAPRPLGYLEATYKEFERLVETEKMKDEQSKTRPSYSGYNGAADRGFDISKNVGSTGQEHFNAKPVVHFELDSESYQNLVDTKLKRLTTQTMNNGQSDLALNETEFVKSTSSRDAFCIGETALASKDIENDESETQGEIESGLY